MSKLYSKCFDEKNIAKAIKIILAHEGSRTAGPDGISRKSQISRERIVQEVKLRLRRYKQVCSKKIQIPKGNNEYRELTIINLFDRIAQQCVYQIIAPIVEQNMSKHSYGFRKGVSAKVPVSKLAAFINASKQVYTVEIDFKKCFDNIPLDKALDSLRELGINDGKLIKTIKHLMWISKGYLGVGLGQGTILGPILANCYLTKLDNFIEENFTIEKHTYRTRDYKRHSNNWKEWLISRNRKPNCKYYRYADDSVIVCNTQEEQQWIYEMLRDFVANNLDIEINEAKTELGKDRVKFLGFYLFKGSNNGKTGIRVAEPDKLYDKLKKFDFWNVKDCLYFLKWFKGILNYYDIVNDLSDFLRKTELRLIARSSKKRKGSSIEQRPGKVIYDYYYKGCKSTIDIFQMRKDTKLSYKEYLINSAWLQKREYIKYKGAENEWQIYLWTLFTRQRGLDAITKEPIQLGNFEIHHVKPRAKGGDNSLDNLILLNTSTHKLLHSSKEVPKEYKRYRKHLK